MRIKYITENETGVKWFRVDGYILGLAPNEILLAEDGLPYDSLDHQSISERDYIVGELLKFIAEM